MRLLIPILCIGAAFAQQPRITNAQFESHALSGSLENELRNLLDRAPGPAWVGYTVPALPGHHENCCGNYNQCCGTCSLERSGNGTVQNSSPPTGPIQLEGSTSLLVLFRLENRAISRIAAYSFGCELDAGGLAFHFLGGVSPSASVSYLSSQAPTHKSAIMAIALHGDSAADGALEHFVAPSQPDKLREDTVFWLGSTRGARGLGVLKRLAQSDPSDHLRDKVMFALSVCKEPDAVPTLIASAKNDASPKVRSQALFWLAHKAGQRETSAITSAIDNDPDTHVKKQAVFALSQLPRDQGIPLLIQVARTNKNAEVRKQAMFWLGQTSDPRALQFFEQTLVK